MLKNSLVSSPIFVHVLASNNGGGIRKSVSPVASSFEPNSDTTGLDAVVAEAFIAVEDPIEPRCLDTRWLPGTCRRGGVNYSIRILEH